MSKSWTSIPAAQSDGKRSSASPPAAIFKVPAAGQAAEPSSPTRFRAAGPPGSPRARPKGGYDCPALMLYAFYQGARITLPRTSQQMRHSGTRVPRSQIQPSDLIVINNDGN
ncbi:NlpC/P60 family protein [Streptomyces sp. BE133]|uniref:NlpC/P60 family protein n=1 Tax=Streptomyces sp. BE133 TaxID=3002523 RepID=UPI002E769BEC|nr:NlpC/P60 family protein [Streptomyces sp. BE133]MEE1804900.1 NlpC/P60 family protein [Streptomyces sp. BE133]